MPTFVYPADGSKTVFNFPSSALAKTARVNGVPVTPVASALTSVTLASAPVAGAVVEVIYGPLNGANPATIPMAVEQTYQPVITPVVSFKGAGADALAFTVDPLARTMVVTTSNVFTSY